MAQTMDAFLFHPPERLSTFRSMYSCNPRRSAAYSMRDSISDFGIL